MSPAEYIARGLRPIPVHPPSAGCRCERAHPKNPEQCLGKVPIDKHWMDRPAFAPHEFPAGCNVALAMGRQPNGDWLLGIDVDGSVDVRKYFGCELPPTLETTSGRGRHYIYRVRKEADFGNWIDLFGTRSETGYKPGCAGSVDLRYARGALVVAPSRHRCGARYQTAGTIVDLPPRASLTIYTARLRAGKRPEARWHGFKEGKCP